MCGGIWWCLVCLDHIWWCLVVSEACLVVSGARLVMLMDIDWYGLIWCIWADIFSNAHNRCADADALMLLMHWCYWSNDAAVVDKMQICVWAHLKGIALSSEFRTVVQCLVLPLVVRPALVTFPLISTIWCFRAYKPYIFCENMILATCQCQHIFCCWVEPSLLLSSLSQVSLHFYD